MLKTLNGLPTFIVIGAMKAGTSSLYSYLDAHPEVMMAKSVEPSFFNDEHNWVRGWDWYRMQFDHQEKPRAYAIGERSTSYAKFPEYRNVAGKIAKYLPDVKLIYLVRNPIERIRSMYVHMIHRKYESRSFEEALADDMNYYLLFSLYHYQLEQYLAYFDVDQIKIVASETLWSKRNQTLREVFRFVGVRDDIESEVFSRQFNSSEPKRELSAIGRALGSMDLYETVERQLQPRLARVFRQITTTEIKKPRIEPALGNRLREQIRPDVEKLSNLTKRDYLDLWNLG